MASQRTTGLIVLSLGILATAGLRAQQPPVADRVPPATSAVSAAPAATPAPAATTPPADANSSAPSPDLLKKARSAGYRPEKKNGVTVFCRSDANLGTRFTTKKCVSSDQLADVIRDLGTTQDSMRQPGACTGSNCSGK